MRHNRLTKDVLKLNGLGCSTLTKIIKLVRSKKKTILLGKNIDNTANCRSDNPRYKDGLVFLSEFLFAKHCFGLNPMDNNENNLGSLCEKNRYFVEVITFYSICILENSLKQRKCAFGPLLSQILSNSSLIRYYGL